MLFPNAAERGAHEAMLLTVGERGYAAATVQEAAARCGIGYDRFHCRYGGKEECFARAYEEASEELCDELHAACRGAASWQQGFRAGFMVGAIEESLSIEIASGRAAEVEWLLPDLTPLATLQFFGEG